MFQVHVSKSDLNFPGPTNEEIVIALNKNSKDNIFELKESCATFVEIDENYQKTLVAAAFIDQDYVLADIAVMMCEGKGQLDFDELNRFEKLAPEFAENLNAAKDKKPLENPTLLSLDFDINAKFTELFGDTLDADNKLALVKTIEELLSQRRGLIEHLLSCFSQAYINNFKYYNDEKEPRFCRTSYAFDEYLLAVTPETLSYDSLFGTVIVALKYLRHQYMITSILTLDKSISDIGEKLSKLFEENSKELENLYHLLSASRLNFNEYLYIRKLSDKIDRLIDILMPNVNDFEKDSKCEHNEMLDSQFNVIEGEDSDEI